MELTTRAKIMISYVMPLRIVDDKTGEVVEGVSLEYFFFGESGETLGSDFVKPKDPSGLRRSKAFLRGSGWIDKFVMAPGIYDADFGMDIDKDGKAKLSLSDISYLSEVSITEVPPAPLLDDGAESGDGPEKEAGKEPGEVSGKESEKEPGKEPGKKSGK